MTAPGDLELAARALANRLASDGFLRQGSPVQSILEYFKHVERRTAERCKEIARLNYEASGRDCDCANSIEKEFLKEDENGAR